MSEAPGDGDELSRRAREVQRRVAEGGYEVDLDALADTLADELDEPDGAAGAESDEAR